MPEANDSIVMEAPARRRFVVDRRTWLRGVGNGLLLSQQGTRCCLGFVGSQCGISDDSMLDVAAIDMTDAEIPVVLRDEDWDECNEAAWLTTAYSINDDRDITDATREAKLIALFDRNSLDLVFEN